MQMRRLLVKRTVGFWTRQDKREIKYLACQSAANIFVENQLVY